ncbi:chromosome segregation and condensation protein ScpA [gamma proteobacterium HdN1]|nr:chromosome segregation and condensation protein ScpA [gamma proteobacterium HdN1]
MVISDPNLSAPESDSSVPRLAQLREQFSQSHTQAALPLALVQGETVTQLPQDLYIPPDALEVFLDAFEGPLDLLLYLIRRQNLDILNIPIAEITAQYMQYVEIMKSLNLELAAEYLVMAALLGEIKSRTLLPRNESADEDEEDPRSELIRRLQEYERFKRAAEDLDSLPRIGRDTFPAVALAPDYRRAVPPPEVDLREVLLALKDVLHRADMFESHQVSREKLSTRERMTMVLDRLGRARFIAFENLFTVEEGRLGVVVTFLAILELVKEQLIELVQTEMRGPIHVRSKARAQDENESSADDTDLVDDTESLSEEAFELDPALDCVQG